MYNNFIEEEQNKRLDEKQKPLIDNDNM